MFNSRLSHSSSESGPLLPGTRDGRAEKKADVSSTLKVVTKAQIQAYAQDSQAHQASSQSHINKGEASKSRFSIKTSLRAFFSLTSLTNRQRLAVYPNFGLHKNKTHTICGNYHKNLDALKVPNIDPAVFPADGCLRAVFSQVFPRLSKRENASMMLDHTGEIPVTLEYELAKAGRVIYLKSQNVHHENGENAAHHFVLEPRICRDKKNQHAVQWILIHQLPDGVQVPISTKGGLAHYMHEVGLLEKSDLQNLNPFPGFAQQNTEGKTDASIRAEREKLFQDDEGFALTDVLHILGLPNSEHAKKGTSPVQVEMMTRPPVLNFRKSSLLRFFNPLAETTSNQHLSRLAEIKTWHSSAKQDDASPKQGFAKRTHMLANFLGYKDDIDAFVHDNYVAAHHLNKSLIKPKELCKQVFQKCTHTSDLYAFDWQMVEKTYNSNFKGFNRRRHGGAVLEELLKQMDPNHQGRKTSGNHNKKPPQQWLISLDNGHMIQVRAEKSVDKNGKFVLSAHTLCNDGDDVGIDIDQINHQLAQLSFHQYVDRDGANIDNRKADAKNLIDAINIIKTSCGAQEAYVFTRGMEMDRKAKRFGFKTVKGVKPQSKVSQLQTMANRDRATLNKNDYRTSTDFLTEMTEHTDALLKAKEQRDQLPAGRRFLSRLNPLSAVTKANQRASVSFIKALFRKEDLALRFWGQMLGGATQPNDTIFSWTWASFVNTLKIGGTGSDQVGAFDGSKDYSRLLASVITDPAAQFVMDAIQELGYNGLQKPHSLITQGRNTYGRDIHKSRKQLDAGFRNLNQGFDFLNKCLDCGMGTPDANNKHLLPQSYELQMIDGTSKMIHTFEELSDTLMTQLSTQMRAMDDTIRLARGMNYFTKSKAFLEQLTQNVVRAGWLVMVATNVPFAMVGDEISGGAFRRLTDYSIRRTIQTPLAGIDNWVGHRFLARVYAKHPEPIMTEIAKKYHFDRIFSSVDRPLQDKVMMDVILKESHSVSIHQGTKTLDENKYKESKTPTPKDKYLPQEILAIYKFVQKNVEMRLNIELTPEEQKTIANIAKTYPELNKTVLIQKIWKDIRTHFLFSVDKVHSCRQEYSSVRITNAITHAKIKLGSVAVRLHFLANQLDTYMREGVSANDPRILTIEKEKAKCEAKWKKLEHMLQIIKRGEAYGKKLSGDSKFQNVPDDWANSWDTLATKFPDSSVTKMLRHGERLRSTKIMLKNSWYTLQEPGIYISKLLFRLNNSLLMYGPWGGSYQHQYPANEQLKVLPCLDDPSTDKVESHINIVKTGVFAAVQTLGINSVMSRMFKYYNIYKREETGDRTIDDFTKDMQICFSEIKQLRQGIAEKLIAAYDKDPHSTDYHSYKKQAEKELELLAKHEKEHRVLLQRILLQKNGADAAKSAIGSHKNTFTELKYGQTIDNGQGGIDTIKCHPALYGLTCGLQLKSDDSTKKSKREQNKVRVEKIVQRFTHLLGAAQYQLSSADKNKLPLSQKDILSAPQKVLEYLKNDSIFANIGKEMAMISYRLNGESEPNMHHVGAEESQLWNKRLDHFIEEIQEELESENGSLQGMNPNDIEVACMNKLFTRLYEQKHHSKNTREKQEQLLSENDNLIQVRQLFIDRVSEDINIYTDSINQCNQILAKADMEVALLAQKLSPGADDVAKIKKIQEEDKPKTMAQRKEYELRCASYQAFLKTPQAEQAKSKKQLRSFSIQYGEDEQFRETLAISPHQEICLRQSSLVRHANENAAQYHVRLAYGTVSRGFRYITDPYRSGSLFKKFINIIDPEHILWRTIDSVLSIPSLIRDWGGITSDGQSLRNTAQNSLSRSTTQKFFQDQFKESNNKQMECIDKMVKLLELPELNVLQIKEYKELVLKYEEYEKRISSIDISQQSRFSYRTDEYKILHKSAKVSSGARSIRFLNESIRQSVKGNPFKENQYLYRHEEIKAQSKAQDNAHEMIIKSMEQLKKFQQESKDEAELVGKYTSQITKTYQDIISNYKDAINKSFTYYSMHQSAGIKKLFAPIISISAYLDQVLANASVRASIMSALKTQLPGAFII